MASEKEFLNKTKDYSFEENFKSCDNFRNANSLEKVSFDNNNQFVIPDDFLVEKIIRQVEFLFSDSNIMKDKFLLKHIRRNKEGYISLKLISSLRKVKALSKDWRVVAYSLKKSKKLQMNEEMTKLKRIEALPASITSDSYKTLLLFHNIPDYWSYENVSKLLSQFQTVKSVVKINSNTDELEENVKNTLALYEGVVSFPFAVVKFDCPTEAAFAVVQFSHPLSIIRLIPVVGDEDLVAKFAPNLTPTKESIQHFAPKYRCFSVCDKLPNDLRYVKHDEIKSSKINNIDIVLKEKLSNQYDKYNNIEKFCTKGKESLKTSPCNEITKLASNCRGDGPEINRWVAQRKLFNNIQFKEPRVIILRQPYGPDDTNGFRARRKVT